MALYAIKIKNTSNGQEKTVTNDGKPYLFHRKSSARKEKDRIRKEFRKKGYSNMRFRVFKYD